MTGCWFWTGSYFPSGYGQVWSRALGRGTQAHRLVYETLVGPIPEGLTIDHLCRVRGCVNPAHLRVVTNRENILAFGSTCLAAANASKERCPHGHAYDVANTYLYDGRRFCRTCKRDEKTRRLSARRNCPSYDAAPFGRGERRITGTDAPASVAANAYAPGSGDGKSVKAK